MTTITIVTTIRATPERCFDASRDLDLHLDSMADTGERAVAGRTSGLIELGEQVTWEGRHFGIRQRFTSAITAYDRPGIFRIRWCAARFTRSYTITTSSVRGRDAHDGRAGVSVAVGSARRDGRPIADDEIPDANADEAERGRESSPRTRSGLTRLLHFLAQAERTHVGPDFMDVGEALRLRTRFAGVVPAEWKLAAGRPDRVLLFMIHDHSVDGGVFPFIIGHRGSPLHR